MFSEESMKLLDGMSDADLEKETERMMNENQTRARQIALASGVTNNAEDIQALAYLIASLLNAKNKDDPKVMVGAKLISFMMIVFTKLGAKL